MVSKFEGQDALGYGTGFLIGKRQVVTACHNTYKKNKKKAAKEVLFYPMVNGKYEKKDGIKAEIVKRNQGYIDADAKIADQRRKSDFALLVLEE